MCTLTSLYWQRESLAGEPQAAGDHLAHPSGHLFMPGALCLGDLCLPTTNARLPLSARKGEASRVQSCSTHKWLQARQHRMERIQVCCPRQCNGLAPKGLVQLTLYSRVTRCSRDGSVQCNHVAGTSSAHLSVLALQNRRSTSRSQHLRCWANCNTVSVYESSLTKSCYITTNKNVNK
jgi:hypothetical protein